MLLAVLLAGLLQTRFQSQSCIAGEGWEFVVRGSEVAKSPRWSDTRDAPPLPPRAAIRAARALLERMSCKDAGDWELSAVALRPVAGEREVWVYVVTFMEPLGRLRGSAVGSVLRRTVDIPVLLDGGALLPAKGSWPPKR